MEHSPSIPGLSVVLKDDPKGPVMTVIQVRKDDNGRYFTVVWLDLINNRCEAEYHESLLQRLTR